MYSKIYDAKKLLNTQIENGDISKEEAKFVDFYWDSIRRNYLSPVAKRSIWIPHIGEFIIKYGPLKVLIIRKLKILRGFKRKGKEAPKLKEELTQLLKIRNEIATERYNYKKHIIIPARKNKILSIHKKDEKDII